MTSLNGNFANYQPQKSDLLQKYLLQQDSLGSKNSTVKTNLPQNNLQGVQNPYLNTVSAPILNIQPEQDKFENKKNNTKSAKIAAASLGGVMVIASATLLGKTNAGKKLIKQAGSLISKGYEKILQKLRSTIGSEKVDNAIRNFYDFRDDKLVKFSNASTINVVNGKDVFSRNAADFVTGRKIDMSKLSGTKKKAAEIYQNTIGRVLSWFHLLDKHSTKLYTNECTKGGIRGYANASKKYGDYSKTTLEELKKVLNSNPDKKFKINGNEKTGKELLQKIETLFDTTGKNIDDLTSEINVKGRITTYNNILKGINSNGEKIGQSLTEKTTDGFLEKLRGKKFKDLFEEPIAANILEGDKTKYAVDIKSKVDAITYTAGTIIEDNTKNIAGLKKILGTADIDVYNEIDKTLKHLDRYKRSITNGTIPPAKAQEEICTKLNDLISNISKTNNPKNEQAIEIIETVKQSLSGKIKNGSAEEIMDIAREVLDHETYNIVVLPKYRAFQRTLKSAYNNEVVDVLDKLRDINCGSAPTDFITLIGSAALMGVYTAQAENNDERVSLGLTTGLPLLSTVGTNLLCAMKSISGGKSLAISLITGGITKKVCEGINKIYRKSKGLDEDTKPSIVTIDDYIPYKDKFGRIFFVPAGTDLNMDNNIQNA